VIWGKVNNWFSLCFHYMLFKIPHVLYTMHLFEVLFMLYELIWSIILKNCIPLPQVNHVFICAVLILCTEYLYIFCCIFCVLIAYSFIYFEINSKTLCTYIPGCRSCATTREYSKWQIHSRHSTCAYFNTCILINFQGFISICRVTRFITTTTQIIQITFLLRCVKFKFLSSLFSSFYAHIFLIVKPNN